MSKAFLQDLALKIIHYSGTPSLTQLIRRIGLGPGIVQQVISALAEEHLVEVMSQSDLYTGNYRYRLTERGMQRVVQAPRAQPLCRTLSRNRRTVRRGHPPPPPAQAGLLKDAHQVRPRRVDPGAGSGGLRRPGLSSRGKPPSSTAPLGTARRASSNDTRTGSTVLPSCRTQSTPTARPSAYSTSLSMSPSKTSTPALP